MENILNDLNTFLCDLNVFYRKLQNYHWNIKGKDFFVVHEKLEEYYNEINMQIDEVAEHILSIDGQPLATLEDYIKNAKIKEAKNEKIESTEIFKEPFALLFSLARQAHLNKISSVISKFSGFLRST